MLKNSIYQEIFERIVDCNATSSGSKQHFKMSSIITALRSNLKSLQLAVTSFREPGGFQAKGFYNRPLVLTNNITAELDDFNSKTEQLYAPVLNKLNKLQNVEFLKDVSENDIRSQFEAITLEPEYTKLLCIFFAHSWIRSPYFMKNIGNIFPYEQRHEEFYLNQELPTREKVLKQAKLRQTDIAALAQISPEYVAHPFFLNPHWISLLAAHIYFSMNFSFNWVVSPSDRNCLRIGSSTILATYSDFNPGIELDANLSPVLRSLITQRSGILVPQVVSEFIYPSTHSVLICGYAPSKVSPFSTETELDILNDKIIQQHVQVN